MLVKQFVKLSYLNKQELRSIRNLVEQAAQHDKFSIKLYLSVLQNRLTQEFNDLLYFINGNLVGYLGIFTFELYQAEVTAVVHPKYRRQGIFKKLLSEAFLELKQRNVPDVLFIRPQDSIIDQYYLKPYKPKYCFSQLEMVNTAIPILENLPQIQLRLANPSDLALVANLGAVGFEASFTEVFQKFSDDIKQRHRKIWLVSIKDEQVIGKIHLRYDDPRVFIHDICIAPEHRGKKYALAMMLKIMMKLEQEGHKKLYLEVETDNPNAVKLYIKCGFKKVSEYDFWQGKVPITL